MTKHRAKEIPSIGRKRIKAYGKRGSKHRAKEVPSIGQKRIKA